MKKNIYENTARFYDGGNHRNFNEDIRFYKKFIKSGMKVLDIGCGTGRVALALLQEDIQIVGIDLSGSMLEIFKEKLSALHNDAKNKVKIIQADMTHFDLKEKFDLILFPFRVFQALTTNQQRDKCLENVKNHLGNDGKIIINAFDPDNTILDSFDTMNNTDYAYYDEKLMVTVVRKSIGVGNNKIKKTIKAKYVFEITDSENNISIIEDIIELGYMEKHEMDEMFRKNQLVIEKVYSWWDFSEFVENEKRELIYILKK